MLTKNEKKILRFLLAHFDSDYSINEIAKNCNLAPNGAYEILKKFENKGILLVKKIANVRSYKINFKSIEANKLLELILIPDYKEPKIRHRYNDLKPLKEITKLCIIFGSYITKKENPNDLDVIFVIGKADHKRYTETLEKVKRIVPLKLHDVIQTKIDLAKNIKNKESIIIDAISDGKVLWGHEFLIETIKNVAER
ncbi:MAG: winged helix-turn-helix domain-containing protein [Candidatus Woesearchaeota archaeon]